jgi:hypothetical protein
METEKKFSKRRFVSVMTLCTFVLTGISGLVLLFSHGPAESGGVMINWKGMHEIGCIFFVIFGVWHLILNFKVLCTYFKGRERRFAFRMDWVIPVAISLAFITLVSLIPEEKHEFKGKYPPEFYERHMGDDD